MQHNSKNFLTDGLLSGFCGESAISPAVRAGLNFCTSQVEREEFLYRDEWLDSSIGGGQEVLAADEHSFTRLYCGGVSHENLRELSIDESAVLGFLKTTLIKLSTRTRLDEDCQFEAAQWHYHYKVLDRTPSISARVAKESILFEGVEVFVHYVISCPITPAKRVDTSCE